MKRFLNYDYRLPGALTAGIVLRQEASPRGQVPRERGKILHSAAEVMWRGGDWRTVVAEGIALIPEEFRAEQHVLIRRALLGWQHQRGELLSHYEVVSAEAEWKWTMDQAVQQALRLDRVLRRKDDGLLGILDFKTMTSMPYGWISKMRNSEQTHLYIQALKERSGEYVLGMIYEGIVVGKLNAQNKPNSPFVQAFEKPNGDVSLAYGAGWRRFATLDWDDQQWLDLAVRSGVLETLYVTSGPLLPPDRVLLQTKSATVNAEIVWDENISAINGLADEFGEGSEEHQAAIEQLIERNPDACMKFGEDYSCSYISHCWDGAMIDEDTYMPREDHHA